MTILSAFASVYFMIASVAPACANTKVARPWRVLPYGDSITRGKDDLGYRPALREALDHAGVKFNFVGRLVTGDSNLAHEGHNGAVIDDLIANVDDVIAHAQPDVILLMIGANDVEGRRDLPGMAARYQTLLNKIIAAAPHAHVLVSEITLIRPTEFDAMGRAFNPKIKEVVEARAAQGAAVTFVPMHDVLDLDELDAIDHPDARGNRKIAARFFEYLPKMTIGPEAERLAAIK